MLTGFCLLFSLLAHVPDKLIKILMLAYLPNIVWKAWEVYGLPALSHDTTDVSGTTGCKFIEALTGLWTCASTHMLMHA